MHYRRIVCLAILTFAEFCFPSLVKADSCGPGAGSASNCFFNTDVVNVDYGTLTLLAPDGSLISTTNIVTAETGLSSGESPGIVALFPSLLGQLQADPQSTFANLPPWLFTGLTNLEDMNGFGAVTDPTAFLETPPDPAVVSFDAQLANVGGPYTTLSDTGFQNSSLIFNPAYCAYIDTFFPGECSGPGSVNGLFAFTYQLGPQPVGDNIYTSLVNFQIFSRDVTEQLAATPEPGMLLPLGIGVAMLGFARRAKLKARPNAI